MRKILSTAVLFLFALGINGTNPDDEDYRAFCAKLDHPHNDPNGAKSRLEPVLARLQTDGLLPEENPIEKAEEICEDPENHAGRVCTFLRKHQMANNILIDYNNFEEVGLHRIFYLRLWCKHPECLVFRENDCPHGSFLNEGLDGYFDCTDEDLMKALSDETSVEVRKEAHKQCVVSHVHGPFCLTEKLIGIQNRCRRQDEMSSFLTAEQFNRAVMLNYAAMKAADPETFNEQIPSNEAEQELYSENMNMIFDLFNQGKYEELAKYMDLLPDAVDIVPRCTNLATAGFDESKQRECILGQVIDQVRQFIKTLPGHKTELGGKERKFLNTNINYKTYLEQSQIEQILGIVQNQEFTILTIADNLKKELDKNVGERFQEMKTYFTQVEGFNQEIAKADIGYIHGTLQTYESQVQSISVEVGKGLIDLLGYALATASLELAQKTVVLAMQIADACNPLKTLFGGGAATDVIGAVDEVAEAIAQIAKAGSLIAAFATLKDKTISILTKFEANSVFLENVKELIDKIDIEQTSDSSFEEIKLKFVQKYNDYSPQVTKPDLTEMTEYWEAVIEEACNVIESSTAAAAVAVKAVVNGKGTCWKLPIKAKKMIEIYSEIYDFQFDLMDGLAAYVRASTAVNYAGDMNANYDHVARSNPEEIMYFLQQLAGLSFITNQVQRIQTIENYCDVLEYKEGGARPSVCKGTSTDIKSLIAHEGSACSSQIQYESVRIQPVNEADRAYLNLADLFQGETVTFQIPDGQWLVDNGWIHEDEKDTAIYLTKFEVYLPTESQSSRKIKVVAKITGGNKLTNSKKEYMITPQKSLVYDYSEGQNTVCRSESIANPYKLCETDTPAEICPHTVETDCEQGPVTALHGSVYAQWSVRLTGYSSKVAIPVPATPVPVKIGIELCKMTNNLNDLPIRHKRKHHSGKKHWSKKLIKDAKTRRCCDDGTYWSVADNSCQACPDESVRRLHGYYCDKNHETLSF